MALTLMFITNRPEIATIAERCGVDRVFVDLESYGKEKRQGGMDTVQNAHTIADVRSVRGVLTSSQLLVRINPLHDEVPGWTSSRDEIDSVVSAGADVVMLPFFRSADDARSFVSSVGGRARTCLLVETPEAVDNIDEILSVPGVDEIHLGLNDLALGYGRHFLFELLADGTVERLGRKIAYKGLPFGFGGVASLGAGLVPAEMIIKEHYRLGSTMAILSRSFCNANEYEDLSALEYKFGNGVRQIRELERECERHRAFFMDNKRLLREAVSEVVS